MMRDKILALDEFNEKYRELNETNKKTFSKIVNKLIKETFIVKEKESDKSDYLYVLENKALFLSYFELSDYELVVDRFNDLCYIKTTENRNRVRLNKFATCLLLIFRQLYYIKRKEITTDNQVVVQLEDIIEKVKTSKVFNEDKKINAYKEALPLLRNYKIIDYKASIINESLPIRILPSIQVVVPQDKLEEINARLSAMKNMSDEGDDIDEKIDED